MCHFTFHLLERIHAFLRWFYLLFVLSITATLLGVPKCWVCELWSWSAAGSHCHCAPARRNKCRVFLDPVISATRWHQRWCFIRPRRTDFCPIKVCFWSKRFGDARVFGRLSFQDHLVVKNSDFFLTEEEKNPSIWAVIMYREERRTWESS